MQKKLLFLLMCCISFFAFGQYDDSVFVYNGKQSNFFYSWGNKKTKILITQYGDRKDIVMLNLHDDETTSVEAAKTVLKKKGGTLIEIENGEQRLISFVKNGKTYKFDPNRMFTKTGIRASLLRHSKRSSDAAIKAVYAFSKFVLNKISADNRTLIALHNNDEGRLSINSYLPGGEYKKEALLASKFTEQDPDNFFLTTDKDCYEKMISEKFNTVLQNNNKVTDDGSLSVYYGKRNKSYINVEAQIGQLTEQTAMIERLLAD